MRFLPFLTFLLACSTSTTAANAPAEAKTETAATTVVAAWKGGEVSSTELDESISTELTKLKAEYEALSDGPPLVKGAGGQWVLPPEEIGYEVLDVAEWDASKEKEAEFEAVFDKKAEAAARQVRRHPSAMLAVF